MRKIIKISFITVCILVSSLTFSQNQIDPGFRQLVNDAASKLGISQSDMSDPVTVNAAVVWNKTKDKIAVIVKASILEGWHIYAFVPQTQPYIQYKMELKLPEGVEPITDWEVPAPFPYEDGIFVFREELIFTRFFEIQQDSRGEIFAGLFYQTCDIKQCLPPQSKIIEVDL